MTRASTLSLVLSVGFAACASSEGVGGTTECFCNTSPAITWLSFFSAYDGVHDYKLAAAVPPPGPDEDDPIDISTVRWKVDEKFVDREDYADLPASLLLTTKKPGVTTIHVTAKTRSGVERQQSSSLTISPADITEWNKGDDRYSRGPDLDIDTVDPGTSQNSNYPAPCDLSAAERERIPKSAACAACHKAEGGLSWEPTPIQIAHYDSDELIEMFSNAMKPLGGVFRSPFLQQVSKPDCVYQSFHTWEIGDDTKLGIIWKLRSLEPRKRDADAWD